MPQDSRCQFGELIGWMVSSCQLSAGEFSAGQKGPLFSLSALATALDASFKTQDANLLFGEF